MIGKKKGFTSIECVISLFIVSMIKNSSSVTSYNKKKYLGDYVVETVVKNTRFLDCYSLDLKVISDLNTMELKTYVRTK